MKDNKRNKKLEESTEQNWNLS